MAARSRHRAAAVAGKPVRARRRDRRRQGLPC